MESLNSEITEEALFAAMRSMAKIQNDAETSMATYAEYFDESGKLADSRVVVFAGAFASLDDWEAMSRQWRRELRRARVSHVSMKEAIHGRGPFAEWKNSREKERDELLLTLADIAQRKIQFSVSSPSNTETFKQLAPVLQQSLKNPQYCAFEACIRGIIERMQEHPNDRVHLCCDASEEYSELCLSLYLKLRRNNALVRHHCSAIMFGEDEDFPPLQVADMLAYCRREQWLVSEGIEPKYPIVVGELLEIFDRNTVDRDAGLRYLGTTALGEGKLTTE